MSFNQLEEGHRRAHPLPQGLRRDRRRGPADQIERGYEISKGRYVIVEPDELDTLRPKGSHEIEIEEFVDLDDIDPLYFEQPYYLVPDKRGEKPYKLLVDAMKSSSTRSRSAAIVDAQQGAARRDPPARRHAVRRDDALRRRGAAR